MSRRSRSVPRRKQASPPRQDAKAASPRAADVAVHGDRSAPPRRWVPWFSATAAYVGFVISLYLTFVHYRGYVSPCYVVHGCEQVQTSQYSAIAGIPVALLGTIFFGLMFYLAIGLLTGPGPALVSAYKVLAFLGALAVIPLFLLQALVLKAFCSYCVATEIVMLSMWIVSFLLTSPQRRREAVAVRS